MRRLIGKLKSAWARAMEGLFGAEPAREQSSWMRVLSLAVLLIAVGAMVQFLVVACVRARYPFELEWIEGAYVDQAGRVLAGQPLYPSPTISFVPLNKTPFFFLLSGSLMKLTGAGFAAPRLISILSTVGCFVLIAQIVAQDSGHLAPGIMAAGVYAMAFRFAGAWMDLAKTDSLLLCLILGAYFISRRYPSYPGMVVSGACYVLAYYTKQAALPMILVIAPISLLTSGGRPWLQWTAAGILGLAAFLALDSASDGWFSFYTFDALAYHERIPDLLLFWKVAIPRLWPALLLSLLYPISVLADRGFPGIFKMEGLWQDLSLGGALLIASWSVYVKVWTYDNGLMPACLGVAVLLGLGYTHSIKLGRAPYSDLFEGGALALILCQFVLLAYNPLEQLPTHKEYNTWKQFVDEISELPGDVLVFHHGFVNHLAGKRSYLHSSPYGDVVGWAYEPGSSDHRSRREETRQVLDQAISEQSFSWIVSGGSRDRWLPYYLPSTRDPFTAPLLTGAPAGPESFFVRNPMARGGEFPLTETTLDHLLDRGWSEAEEWGRWATGGHSTMELALQEGDYSLIVQAFPFCTPEFDGQAMEIGWNDRSLGKYVFRSCENLSIRIDLPSRTVTGGLDTLWIQCEKAVSPRDVGLSDDGRELSVGLTALALERVEE